MVSVVERQAVSPRPTARGFRIEDPMTRNAFLLLPLLALFGCSPGDVEKIADDVKEATATRYIQNVIDGEFDALRGAVEPSLKPRFSDELMREMQALLGSEVPKERRLIGYSTHTFNSEPTRYNLSYQYG